MREGVEQDILIPSWDIHTALDGDQAMSVSKAKSTAAKPVR